MHRGLLLAAPPFALAACGGSPPAHMAFRLNGTTVPSSVVRQKRERPVYLWLDGKDQVRRLQLKVFFGVATRRFSRFGEHLHVTVPRRVAPPKGSVGSWERLQPCK